MARLSATFGPPGPGRTLAVAYAIFALAAGARSISQIAGDLGDAPPLSYLLSALAAAIYLVAAATIGRPEPSRLRIARIACIVELAGVLAVGTYGLIDPDALAAGTVWGGFGSGYGYLPLVLPMLGLLRIHAATPEAGAADSP